MIRFFFLNKLRGHIFSPSLGAQTLNKGKGPRVCSFKYMRYNIKLILQFAITENNKVI